MGVPGVEAGIHVFFALLAMFSFSALAYGLYVGNKAKLVKTLAIIGAILVWLSWFTVIPVYTKEYGSDKAVIKEFEQTATAHRFGMETKEHIFYTGLMLATALGISVFYLDLNNPAARKYLLAMALTLLIGGFVLELLGGWISTSAKVAWSIKAGGG